MLRLSIVTTLYKSAGYMDKCLVTLLDQDIAPEEYEIILVNDGSPDDSLQIARRYESEYPNVKVVSYEVNRGLAGARQVGTDATCGEYLCYVDPDDYIERRSFSAVLEQMEKEKLDLLRFNYRMVNENGEELTKPQDARIVDYSPYIMDGITFLTERLGYGCFVWAYIYRTALIKDSGVKFRQGDYFDDTAWLPQIIRKAERINSNPVVRYNYFQRTDSLVNTVTIESIARKLDAQIVVIERLNEQIKYAEPTALSWYKGMNSKLAFAVLSSAAVYMPEVFEEYLDKLKGLNVFPLRCPNVTGYQKVKIALLNIAPRLFRLMIYRKNK